MPKPNRIAPTPQPAPKTARIKRALGGESEYTGPICGISVKVMIQLKTNMPRSENVAQGCSQDHRRTRVMGSTKVPCSKPASNTRRNPASRDMHASKQKSAVGTSQRG